MNLRKDHLHDSTLNLNLTVNHEASGTEVIDFVAEDQAIRLGL